MSSERKETHEKPRDGFYNREALFIDTVILLASSYDQYAATVL